MDNPAWNRTVFGIFIGVDLYRRSLALIHKADILVLQEGLNLEMVVLGNDLHQGLRRRHYSADGVHGQLLHRTIYWSDKAEKPTVRSRPQGVLPGRRHDLFPFGQASKATRLVSAIKAAR